MLEVVVVLVVVVIMKTRGRGTRWRGLGPWQVQGVGEDVLVSWLPWLCRWCGNFGTVYIVSVGDAVYSRFTEFT